MPIRCAVIGLGAIGSQHAAILASSPRAELICCCDVDLSRADRTPGGAAFTADLTDALSHEGLEAVFVCTPQAHHLEAVQAAIDRNLAVFCEKPIADTVAAADKLISSVAAGSATVVIGHVLRFDHRYQEILAAADAGELGVPLELVAGRHTARSEGVALAGRTSLAVEMAVHDIDILRAIAGDVARVYAETCTIGPMAPDAAALVASLRFASGAVASIETNWVLPDEPGADFTSRLQVTGTEGCAVLEIADVGNVLQTEDEYFLEMLAGGPPWPVSLDDARGTLAVAIAIDRSLQLQRPVSLDELA